MPLPPGADLTTNPDELINDPEIDVLVELMGGIDAPRTIIDRALDAGKHIVTANKALLAEHIRTCVASDIRAGKDEVIDELVETLQKLMK